MPISERSAAGARRGRVSMIEVAAVLLVIATTVAMLTLMSEH
jgi:hypothetical protein